MNKFTKAELRNTLMYLKQVELIISEALEDIIEIIEESNQKLKRDRRLQLKRAQVKTLPPEDYVGEVTDVDVDNKTMYLIFISEESK